MRFHLNGTLTQSQFPPLGAKVFVRTGTRRAGSDNSEGEAAVRSKWHSPISVYDEGAAQVDCIVGVRIEDTKRHTHLRVDPQGLKAKALYRVRQNA